jgi:threonyl-tRNA synthetase
MGKRIREAEMQKVPVMLVCGDRDVEAGTVSVRRRGEGDLGAKTRSELLDYLKSLLPAN